MNIVITQPMYFPWIGLFEQILLSDKLVIYDDVEFSKGSFTNRVQLKSPIGQTWMSLPLEKYNNGKKINEYCINGNEWKKQHLNLFASLYKDSFFFKEAFNLLEKCTESKSNRLVDVTYMSMQLVLDFFEIKREILFSSQLKIDGKSSERVFNIVKGLSGSNYITGHGAINYLDHDLFENDNINVSYIQYEKKPYSQLYSAFIPYVSVLDLIANLGKDGINCMVSKTIDWKKFKN